MLNIPSPPTVLRVNPHHPRPVLSKYAALSGPQHWGQPWVLFCSGLEVSQGPFPARGQIRVCAACGTVQDYGTCPWGGGSGG